MVAPISSLKTRNLDIILFSIMLSQNIPRHRIISVFTGENYMSKTDVAPRTMVIFDGWDGNLGGVGRTLQC